MNQIWQYWTSTLTEEQLNHIISHGENAPVSEAGLGFDGGTANHEYRSSEIRWLNPYYEPLRPLVDLLWHYGQVANKNAFGFYIDHLPDIQYTKYFATEQGHYDWHCDTFWANPTMYDRKLSIVIQLSDSDDYEGGDFQVDPQYPQLPADEIRKKGTVIVFPSFINHRVTTVTGGERRSLVSWLQGPKFR